MNRQPEGQDNARYHLRRPRLPRKRDVGVSAPPLLAVERLTVGYGQSPVVRDVFPTVGVGGIGALVGANGAGKTTTSCVIVGAVRPQAGTVLLGGRSLKNLRLHQLTSVGAAYVPEDRCSFAELTTGKNLHLDRGDLDQRLEWFAAVGTLLGRLAGLLSGGKQQMLAPARALARRPPILIDKISAGLAPMLVEHLLALLRRLADEAQLAVLFVEQHVDLALACADRGYVLRHGELVAEGPASGLARDHHSLEASFLGEVL